MKHRLNVRMLFSLFAFSLFFSIAQATKPCPPIPCNDQSGQFNKDTCTAKADWIALGTIRNIVHNRMGQPLNKDFAKFTFTIKNWEKNPIEGIQELHFTVGWCDNSQIVPDPAPGLFRIYGLAIIPGENEQPRYLGIEPVQEKKKKPVEEHLP